MRYSNIVNLSDLKLNSLQEKVLNKGLNFVVTPKNANLHTTLQSFDEFRRKMLLQVHFKDNKNDTTASPFRGKSSWEPEFVRNPNIYKYLDNVDILNLYTQNYYNPLNISKEEQEAIRSLKQIDNISIKKGDKAGKIVLWPKDMYLRKATKQLDDANFYKEHPVDHTIETSAEIITFLAHLLHN